MSKKDKARHEGDTPEGAQCGLPADKSSGNPYDSPFVRDLVSPQKSRNELAAGHKDLRQSNANAYEALGSLRTARGNIEDLKPFADDITPGGFSHAGEVALRLFDAAGQAGASGALHPTANPLRPADHTARGSASPCDEGCGSGAHVDSDFLSDAISRGAVSENVRDDIRNDVTSHAVAAKHQVLDMLKDMARKATQ